MLGLVTQQTTQEDLQKLERQNSGQLKYKVYGQQQNGRDNIGAEKANQDRILTQRPFLEEENALYGIFDGHGLAGAEVAEFVKQYLPALIMKNLSAKDMKQTFSQTYKDIQSILSHKTTCCKQSGTTSSVVYIKDNMAYLSWVGDSKVVIGVENQSLDQCIAVEITHDHNLSQKKEQDRIYEHKGSVRSFSSFDEGPLRVWPGGLAMSRSLGDLLAHQYGVTEQPEFRSFNISENVKFMLLATDGVWEYVSPQRSITIMQRAKSLEIGVNQIISEATGMWEYYEDGTMDDISIIALAFEK